MAKAAGSVARKNSSFIEAFVAHTDNLDSPPLFRKWCAISAIGAALEQKVWLLTSSRIYPNFYIFLVGPPATGKTRAIRVARELLKSIPEPSAHHFAPVSLTSASLVDALSAAKRQIIVPPNPAVEYNSMSIIVDEMGTFIHKHENDMIALLSAFYDPDPYSQNRRGKDIKITIKSPQLSILCGSTPSNLMEFMPEGAWEQGFTSRIMMIYSEDKIIGDDFAQTTRAVPKDLVADMATINGLQGQFQVTEEYRNAVNAWRQAGESTSEYPAPTHPKLLHYNGRRRVHLYKLSMVAAIDRANALILDKAAFNTAFGWLMEAEAYMPDVFRTGATGGDRKAMEEIRHFVEVRSKNGAHEVPGHLVIHFASDRVPNHSVMRILELMSRSKMIFEGSLDPTTMTPAYNIVPTRRRERDPDNALD